jgi:hypothetical protein
MIGVFICHKQKQSSISIETTERACSPSRAVDLSGKFAALELGAVEWLSAKIIAHTPTGLQCIAVVLFAVG